MAFLRPAYYRVSAWNFRVFEACLLSRNMEDRTAGNERERDRVREREIPEFPKPRRARAAVWQHEPLRFLLIAQMQFRPIIGWTKRAYYGE